MRRGELYRVPHPSRTDPKRSRVFVVVSRQAVIESRFSTVVCAPVYSTFHGLPSQVEVLISLPKSVLTDFIGCLSSTKVEELNRALAAALDLPPMTT